MKICLYDKSIKTDPFLSEYINSVKKEKICIFNSEDKNFYDFFGDPLDLENETIIPISGIEQLIEIREYALKKGIKLFVTPKDSEKVSNWFDYYKPNRKIIKYIGKDLLKKETIEYMKQYFGEKIFFKTINKDFSAITSTIFLEQEKSVLYKSISQHLETEFLISDAVEILTDDLGKKEYRCIVINGKLRNISRLTEDIVHQIDSIIIKRCEEIINELSKTSFSKSYVIDLMEYKIDGKAQIDAIEFNDICASGMYLYNSIIDLDTSDLEHNELLKLPKSKRYMQSKLKKDGKLEMTPSKLYNLQGSFAQSVKENCGELSGCYIHYHDNKQKRYEQDECLGDEARSVTIRDFFSNFTPIESESDLKVKKLEIEE